MKKLLFFSFLFITFYSQAQWNPTGSRTRFVPGIGIGTRDTSWYGAADTAIIVLGRDSVLYFKYQGFWKAIGSGSGGGTTTNPLTLGSGLLGTSFNGSAAVTAKVDTSTISTKANVTALLTGYASGASVVKYTDTAAMLGNYYNKTATDSRLALKLNISDTASMLSTHPNTTLVNSQLALKLDKSDSTIANRVTSDRNFVNASLALKVNYTDTASMLSTHPNTTLVNSLNALNVKYTDTASMLSTHPNKTYVDANVATKQNTLSLTTTGTSGAATLVGATLNIPQYAGGGGGGTVTSVAINNASGLTGTTPITSTGTIGADTSILSTKANVIASLIGYAANALVVKYTDTTSMLSTHPNLTYVTSNLATKLNVTDSVLANRITSDRNFVNASLPLKVNVSDTATMLGNYVRTNNYGILKNAQAFGADTSALSTKANVVALLTGYTAGALVVKYTDTATVLGNYIRTANYGTTKTGQALGVDTSLISTKANVTASLLSKVGTIGVTTANGVSGTSSGGVSPNLTISLGAITPSSVNTVVLSGSTTPTLAVTGTSSISGSNTGDNSVNSLYSGLAASKVNVSDTAAMLGTNYYNKVTVDGKLGLEVNYTDTSTMLGNYLRTANYGTTKTAQALGVDTSKIIPYTDTLKAYGIASQYFVLTHAGGGGGGTTTNPLTLGSGLTGTSFNGSAAVTATVDTAAFKIATKTDINTETLQKVSLRNPYTGNQIRVQSLKYGQATYSNIIVASGDSRTAGWDGTVNYPYTSSAQFVLNKPFTKINSGVGGANAYDIDTLAWNNVDPYYSNLSSKNIVILWAGVNDMAVSNRPADSVYSNIVAFARARKAQGWQVLVTTEISMTGTGSYGSVDAQRTYLNDSLRNNWARFADGLIDLGANSQLGANGAYTNTTYFLVDGIHLTDRGYDTVAAVMSRYINAYLQSNTNYIQGEAKIIPSAYSPNILTVQNKSGTPLFNVDSLGIVNSSVASMKLKLGSANTYVSSDGTSLTLGSAAGNIYTNQNFYVKSNNTGFQSDLTSLYAVSSGNFYLNNAATTYVASGGGVTVGGGLTATTGGFTGLVTLNAPYVDQNTGALLISTAIPTLQLRSTSAGRLTISENYSATNRTSFLVSTGTATPTTEAISIDHTAGATTFASTVTASSLIKTGGTSAQYLMADGSVSTAAGGGTTTNALTFNNSNSGAASGTTFNGATAQTISANTVGAVALTGSTMTGGLILPAATTSITPLQIGSPGILNTTPVAGGIQVDGNGFLNYTHVGGITEVGVVEATQMASLTTAYTLTSQTAAQKAFNSSTNGALTVAAATTYYFEGLISLSSMSATSGSFGFALGGTATLTSVQWHSSSVKAATLTTATAPQMTFNITAANTTIATASTATNGYMKVWGIVRINASGTLIPQVSLGVAAAAVVGVNSYFKLIPVGGNTTTNIGNWN